MSIGSEAGSEGSTCGRIEENVKKCGYLKKLKTMKKKFFVLRADCANFPACLEYYDSVKKWKNHYPPKRSIVLKSCFNINRRYDTKHKYVIALFTGADCFGLVLECEDDLQEWLRLLLTLQQGEEFTDGGAIPKPYYEHVWKVIVQKREPSMKHNLSGEYTLCLTDLTLCLVKHATDEEQEPKLYEFSLQSIRRYGCLDNFFYIELGQASCLGAGNLWMQAEDATVAEHIKSSIMHACTADPKKDLLPKARSRSSSANESSRPLLYCGRKWPSTGDETLRSPNVQEYEVMAQVRYTPQHFCHSSVCNSVSSTGDGIHHHNHHHHNLTSVPFSPYPPIRRASTGTRPVTTGPALLSSSRANASYSGRERCDSLPTRPRKVSDVSALRNGSMCSAPVNRPAGFNRTVLSPPGFSHPTSPLSAAYSTDSVGSSASVDGDGHWTEMENIGKIILEENSDEYHQWGKADVHLPESFHSSNGNIRNRRNVPMFTTHSSSNSQCSYGSSPMDPSTSYLPLSPECCDIRSKSANHSRESSIQDDSHESQSYVVMAPQSVDTGYMSMDHSGRKLGDVSPGLSSCSVTSGTPSTDVRLSEFHLDRVSSYLSPDDDLTLNVRPTRAYSTGSKPEIYLNKCSKYEAVDGTRVRAFSAGSRTATRFRRTPPSTSTSSVEPCDDMMEIDFSANARRRRVAPALSAAPVNVSFEQLNSHSEYCNMECGESPVLEPYNRSPTYSATRDMKQIFVGKSSPPNMAVGTPTLEKVPETEFNAGETGPYVDMTPGRVITPVVAVAKNIQARKENFNVLDPAKMKASLAHPPIKQPLLNTDGKSLRMTDQVPSGYMDMSFKKKSEKFVPVTKEVAKTPDGYVDMSFKGRKNLTECNMQPRKTEVKITVAGGKENHNVERSNPIAIQSSTKKRGGMFRRKSEEPAHLCVIERSKPALQQPPPKKRHGLFRRKSADETRAVVRKPRPGFLPLSQTFANSWATLGRLIKKAAGGEEEASPSTPMRTASLERSRKRRPTLRRSTSVPAVMSAYGEGVRRSRSVYQLDEESSERVMYATLEMPINEEKDVPEKSSSKERVDENLTYTQIEFKSTESS